MAETESDKRNFNDRKIQQEEGTGKMTIAQAGHLGGEKGGHKGGQRVKDLVEEGKDEEAKQ